jgi:large subunit ribosomal protein L35
MSAEKECKMPKMKSRSAARKRFSLTADGHVKRKKAFKSHILNKKDRKRKRNLRKSTLVYEGVEKKVALMIQM